MMVAQREHDLRPWPAPFAAVRAGLKPFEYRRNDRDFQVGDVLVLREWEPDIGDHDDDGVPMGGAYTGEALRVLVTFVLSGAFGVAEGYCVMAIAPEVEAAPAPGGIDFSNWSYNTLPERTGNVGWRPDLQELIYTAISHVEGDFEDADENCAEQLIERLVLTIKSLLSAGAAHAVRAVAS